MKECDELKVLNRFSNYYKQYGFSQSGVGWEKGRQNLRFELLTSEWGEDENMQHSTFLDLGCGFGHMYPFLIKKYKNILRYKGIDLNSDLINQAKEMFHNEKNIFFEAKNMLHIDLNEKFDYVLSSGAFNVKFSENESNEKFIFKMLEKSFFISNIAVAFNFLSDKVDYKQEHAFYASPERVLNFCYSLTRNLILKNTIFPFEFTIILYKDQSFETNDSIFNEYKKGLSESNYNYLVKGEIII